MGAPNTLGNTKAYDDEQALLAAERRGYLRGVEDAAQVASEYFPGITAARDMLVKDIRALGAKPHD